MKKFICYLFALAISTGVSYSQSTDPVVEAIIKEATENSQLEILAHELMDGIGPRLVGTPNMQRANDWALSKYSSWGIAARN